MKRILIIFLLSLVFLEGCGSGPKVSVSEEGYRVFYLDEEETSVVSKSYQPKEKETEAMMREFLLCMMKPSDELHEAIPSTISFPEVVVGTNGLVTLSFDESYFSVTGVREVLMRAAIVKTLCQTPEVDSVEIYVAGQPLMGLSNNPVGIMKEEDFIDNTGEDVNFYQYLYATVYYANESGDRLVSSNLKIPFSGSETEEEVIIKQLFAGPVEDGMLPVVSDKVKLLDVSSKDGICTVNLNAAFLSGTEKCTEEITVYSLVNTLVEISDIYGVQILINGEASKQVLTTDISKTLERNLELVETE